MFYNYVSNCNVPLVHNLFGVGLILENYVSPSLIEIDADSRCVIHHAVVVAFDAYCNYLADDVE